MHEREFVEKRMAAKIINTNPVQSGHVALGGGGSFQATGVVDEDCTGVYATLQQIVAPPALPPAPIVGTPRSMNVGQGQAWTFSFIGVLQASQYTLTVDASSA